MKKTEEYKEKGRIKYKLTEKFVKEYSSMAYKTYAWGVSIDKMNEKELKAIIVYLLLDKDPIQD